MGNRAFKAAGDQLSPASSLASLCYSFPAWLQTLSLDRLDDTTLLLQTALTTCIRAKERRIAWLCRICLDSEVREVVTNLCTSSQIRNKFGLTAAAEI
eukprot:SM000108S14251  [mRNA]  locus=s108:457670:458672:- [translate_table: standard]